MQSLFKRKSKLDSKVSTGSYDAVLRLQLQVAFGQSPLL